MILGTAEVLIRPVTTGFEAAVKKDTEAALGGFSKDSEAAGVAAGANLRKGVAGETEKLAGDMEQHGARAGEGFRKGAAGGLSKLGSVVAAAGVPIGELSSKTKELGDGFEHAGSRSTGLVGKLDSLGGATLKVGGIAIAAAAAWGVHVAEGMQKADAAIAASSGTSVTAATKIGDTFEGTAFKTEFSATEMATAYAAVAGSLRATVGHALSAAEAVKFQAAANDLATAKQIDLGDATSATAGVMQAYKLSVDDTGHVTDILYSASTATGQSVDQLATSVEKMRAKLGPTAGSLGDLSGLLVDMTKQGITGRAALSGLSSGLTSIMRPTSTTETEIKKLGLTVFDSNGKFKGMGSIIDQLNPKFAGMTQQQQLATASTLFGSTAARQMTAIINAGPAAYDKATAAVNRHGAAQNAAAKQSSTLHGEVQTLESGVSDLAGKLGAILVPAITAFIGIVVKATGFLGDHKAALVAVATVVGGVLATAIGVFTVNKMAAFAGSFKQASGTVKTFAGDVQTAVQKVIGLFGDQSAAADKSAGKIGTSTKAASGAVATEATEIEGSTGAVDTSFASTGTASRKAATKIGTSEAAAAGEVTAADSTIEAENATAAGSFRSLITAAAPFLGAVGAAGAGVALGNAIANATGASKSAQQGVANRAGVGTSVAGPAGTGGPGVNIGPIHIGGVLGGILGGGTGNDLTFSGAATSPAFRSNTARASTAAASVAAVSVFAGLSPNEQKFVAYLAADTGLSPQVIAAWVRNEESTRATPLGHNDFNWLNIDHTDSGPVMGALKGSLWSTAQAAALNTARWMAGHAIGGNASDRGSSGIQAILGAAGKSPAAQMAAITSSGWASGGEALLRQLFNESGGPTVRVPVIGAGKGTVALDSPTAKSITAWAKSQIGHDAENLGANRGTELDALEKQFGMQAQAWCAMFATTAAAMGGASNAVKTASVATIAQWAGEGSHGYMKGIKHRPQVGDLQLFGSEHVGFVSKVNSDGTVTDIEGNTNRGSGAVTTVRESINADGGRFARPIYKGVSGATLSPAQLLAQERQAIDDLIAKQRRAMDEAIIKETNATAARIAREKQSIADPKYRASIGEPVTAADRKRVAHEVAQQHETLRAGVAAQKAEFSVTAMAERAEVHNQTHQQQVALNKQIGDTKTGIDVMSKLVSAVHSGSMKQLQSALAMAHRDGLSKVESSLDKSHSKALQDLSKQLVAVHQRALEALQKKLAEQHAAQAKQRQQKRDNAHAAELTARATLIGDQAKRQADSISDATKVYLDQQAAAGLSGAALVAANAQTSLDQTTASSNRAIDTAQIAVDNAAGGSALAQAQAGDLLANAQATALVQEAQAQSVLDKANAAATAAANSATTPATTTTPSVITAPPAAPTFILNFAGQVTPAGVTSEIVWAMKVGALPAAPATALPA